MCDRSVDDPLVRVLTDRYKLNILRMPRPGIGVGELLIREGKDLRCGGSIARLFDPELDIPADKVVPLPEVGGMTSARLSAAASAAPLAGFLAALGLTGVSSVKAGLQRARGLSVVFGVSGGQYHSADLVVLGDELKSRVLRQDNALYRPGRKFYLATAAATATGMRVGFSADSESGARAALGIQQVIEGQSSFKVAWDRAGYLLFSAAEPVTFGVAVALLTVEGNSLRLADAGRFRAVRGKQRQIMEAREPSGVFFGGREGEVLVDIG